MKVGKKKYLITDAHLTSDPMTPSYRLDDRLKVSLRFRPAVAICHPLE